MKYNYIIVTHHYKVLFIIEFNIVHMNYYKTLIIYITYNIISYFSTLFCLFGIIHFISQYSPKDFSQFFSLSLPYKRFMEQLSYYSSDLWRKELMFYSYELRAQAISEAVVEWSNSQVKGCNEEKFLNM